MDSLLPLRILPRRILSADPARRILRAGLRFRGGRARGHSGGFVPCGLFGGGHALRRGRLRQEARRGEVTGLSGQPAQGFFLAWHEQDAANRSQGGRFQDRGSGQTSIQSRNPHRNVLLFQIHRRSACAPDLNEKLTTSSAEVFCRPRPFSSPRSGAMSDAQAVDRTKAARMRP